MNRGGNRQQEKYRQNEEVKRRIPSPVVGVGLWFLFSHQGISRKASAHEFIPQTGNRQNQFRFLGIGFDFLAQAAHVDVDGAAEDFGAVSPHFAQQFIAGERDAAVVNDILQQPVLTSRNRDRVTASIHAV